MKILNICPHPALSLCRQIFLEWHGFEVINFAGVPEVAAYFAGGSPFDFTLLCFTLSNEERLAIQFAYRSTAAGMGRLVELYDLEKPVTEGIHTHCGTEFFAFMTALAEYQDIPDLSVRAVRETHFDNRACRSSLATLT